MKLDKKDKNYILQLLYNSSEAQMYHNTRWTDRFSNEAIKKKVKEMIVCKEHQPCRILTEIFKQASPVV